LAHNQRRKSCRKSSRLRSTLRHYWLCNGGAICVQAGSDRACTVVTHALITTFYEQRGDAALLLHDSINHVSGDLGFAEVKAAARKGRAENAPCDSDRDSVTVTNGHALLEHQKLAG
jgi:hypothetical protein